MDGFSIPLDAAETLAALLPARQTILPKRLTEPSPSAAELAQIVGAAAHAPDHGQLLPWRWVCIPAAQRPALAEAFAAALRERDPSATPEQAAHAREKAHRSPTLLLLVVDASCGDAAIDLHERLISAGCAVQNMLLTATALLDGAVRRRKKQLPAPAEDPAPSSAQPSDAGGETR